MLSPCTIKRSLIRRLPPQYAAHARDLLSNSQGAEKTSGPRGRLKNRAPRQSITARQLMYLGHRNGLREPEPGYETQRGGCTGGGQHPLRPGTSRAEHRGGGARGGGREAAPLWAPRWDEGAAGSGDPVGAAAPQLPLPGPVGQRRGRPPRQPGRPRNFPPWGLGGISSPREEPKKLFYVYIYICICECAHIYIYTCTHIYIPASVALHPRTAHRWHPGGAPAARLGQVGAAVATGVPGPARLSVGVRAASLRAARHSPRRRRNRWWGGFSDTLSRVWSPFSSMP